MAKKKCFIFVWSDFKSIEFPADLQPYPKFSNTPLKRLVCESKKPVCDYQTLALAEIVARYKKIVDACS
jgi:hypothetical protein